MIVLRQKAAQMIRLAVKAEPTLEVSGFGKAHLEDGKITVTDIIIPPQEGGGAYTDIEKGNLRTTLIEIARKGHTLSDYPVWWHSHCGMTTHPSRQDDDTLELLAESVPDLGWFAGLVTNLRGEYYGWIDVEHPVGLFAELDVEAKGTFASHGVATQVKQMMKRVIDKSPVTPKGAYPSLRGQALPYEYGVWNAEDLASFRKIAEEGEERGR
ncbi:hypothetical protein LCGC14_0410090 [marine sediment metagenome]|uniref:JAB domain-containing protein n=1 Tax=marine sediment metagenome TaxID=412755 RepID=A0A0F9SU61_9ZZZZ